MKKTAVALLVLTLGLVPTAQAASGPSDEQRLQHSNTLADCSAYYKIAAQRDGLSKEARTELLRRSMAAANAAARVTNREVAITRQRQSEQALGAGANSSALDAKYRDGCRAEMMRFAQAPVAQ